MTSSNHAPDVASIVREFADVPGGLLPALQAVQRDDFLTSAGVGLVVDWRNVSARLVLAAPLKRHHPAETDRSDVRVHAYVNVALQ